MEINTDNNKIDIDIIMKILLEESKKWKVPVITLIVLQNKDPFKVLISTIISLRTKDEVTIRASKKLFKILKRPKDAYNLTPQDIEDAIYPAGFYQRKSKQIRDICIKLVEEFDSKVPNEIDTLLTFKGIGRKTANLVLTEGFQIPAMCVDTHVHRISNRIGYIKTNTPNLSEIALRYKLPLKYWNQYNTVLVAFGQQICKPISPWCSLCPIEKYCSKINVNKQR